MLEPGSRIASQPGRRRPTRRHPQHPWRAQEAALTNSQAAAPAAPAHQRFSSSPYTGAHKVERRVIAQGARWAGLKAPGCALCGRKSPPRRTLGWHRRAPKAHLELRWVRPGILQAHPEKYKGAPWLGRGPHRQGKGAPPSIARTMRPQPTAHSPQPARHSPQSIAHISSQCSAQLATDS
jgi:hypothetical protein